MRLILHIGTEKTGSTALQEHLASHRDALLRAGIAMPSFLGSNNHRALASVFLRDDLDDDYLRAHKLVDPAPRHRHREQLLRKLRQEVEQTEGSADSYLVSSEHFHSRLLDPAEVQAFADAVAPLFDEVRVICYLRRQDRMALSFYTQKLRGGFVPPSILPIANVRRLAPMLPPFFDFASLLQRWAGVFGDVAIEPVVYSNSGLRGGDVVADFYGRLGCPLPTGERPFKANESLSAAAQLALLAFNRAQGGDLESRTRSRNQREALSAFLQSEASGKGLQPSRAEAEEFLSAFADSNRIVAERWFGRDTLFLEDDVSYPEDGAELDWQGASRLLARFLAGTSSAAEC